MVLTSLMLLARGTLSTSTRGWWPMRRTGSASKGTLGGVYTPGQRGDLGPLGSKHCRADS